MTRHEREGMRAADTLRSVGRPNRVIARRRGDEATGALVR